MKIELCQIFLIRTRRAAAGIAWLLAIAAFWVQIQTSPKIRQKQRRDQHTIFSPSKKNMQEKEFLEEITVPVEKRSSKMLKNSVFYLHTEMFTNLFPTVPLLLEISRNTTSRNFANFTK
jgi:hypothetical protein